MTVIISENSRQVSVNTHTYTTKLSAGIDDTVAIIPITGVFGLTLPADNLITIGSEQITFTGIDLNAGTITGCTRGANATTAAAHVISSVVTVTDTSGDGTSSFDYIYLDKLTGTSLALYLSYTGLTAAVDDNVLISYATKIYNKEDSVAWFDVTYINSSNVVTDLIQQLTAPSLGASVSKNVVGVFNQSDSKIRIKITYRTASATVASGAVINGLHCDLKFAELKTFQ